MEMKIFEKTGNVEIWLTGAEKNDPHLRERLREIYTEWKKKGCLVTVFESGEGDLYRGTLDLLAYNRKRLAEREARRSP